MTQYRDLNDIGRLQEANRQLKDLVQELQNTRKHDKAMIKLYQAEVDRARRYGSLVRCRLQDLRVLLDGLSNNRPVEETMDKCLFVLNEEDRKNDEQYDEERDPDGS